MKHRNDRQDGFALVTAMIFLVLLTLVALVALRSSGLEALTSSNNAQRMEAFESSETARSSIGDVIDAHVYNHGWPSDGTKNKVSGGQVPCSQFGSTLCAANNPFVISNTTNWYGANSEDSGNGFDPSNLDADASYTLAVGTGSGQAIVKATLSIYKLRVDLAPGAGTAMVQGYEGLGRSAASGGGSIFFYVKSRGTDLGLNGSTASSNYDTSADFRYVIRN